MDITDRMALVRMRRREPSSFASCNWAQLAAGLIQVADSSCNRQSDDDDDLPKPTSPLSYYPLTWRNPLNSRCFLRQLYFLPINRDHHRTPLPLIWNSLLFSLLFVWANKSNQLATGSFRASKGQTSELFVCKPILTVTDPIWRNLESNQAKPVWLASTWFRRTKADIYVELIKFSVPLPKTARNKLLFISATLFTKFRTLVFPLLFN